jgi:hypothetical protein
MEHLPTVRDRTKDAAYYTDAIRHRLENSAEVKENIRAVTHNNTTGLYEWLQSDLVGVADLLYSRGDEVEAIVPFIEEALGLQAPKMALYRSRRILPQNATKEATTDDYPEFQQTSASLVEHYYSILSLLSRAVLLNIDAALFERYAWDVTRPGVDYVLDRLIHHQLPDWPVKGKLHYARKFEDLHCALEAGSEEERIVHLTSYTTNWMKKMRGNPLFGPHMLKAFNYTGYWCFPAAAVALITRTPNDGLKDLKHYPAAYKRP